MHATSLRIADFRINPVLDDAPIEPRSEFLDRVRREELEAEVVDARIAINAELQAAGLRPIWSDGTASLVVAGRRCRLVPDATAPAYADWLSGLVERETPVRQAYRRLQRDARLASEGE
jgi:hypothetical protein